jgi:hypothetical protein
MRQVLTGLAAGLLVSCAVSANAQQGSVQVSATVQGVTGDAQRLGSQNRIEPDLGISWLQPGSRFGIFQIELHGTRRGDQLHAGRTYLSLRDLKYRGIAWTIEGGDAYFSPGISDYRFSNLFAPSVTFSGGAATGRTARSTISLLAGRTTAWRNIFGSDPEALGQSLAVLRATHRPADRLELSTRASRVRTTTLKEFSYTIDASDEAGAGAKFAWTPSLQIVADGSVVSYRRTGAAGRERDGSFMTGANWLHSRGWLQVNASRFSPGEFPVLNYPLQDREALFSAGEYDLLPRLRVSAGWEAFRSNLRPESSRASSRPTPQGSGAREFGSVRMQASPRSSITLRAEQGARVSRPIGFGTTTTESDTGSWGAEWQAAMGRANTFARYARRENVERTNRDGSYTQHDASAQIFVNATRTAQIFGSAMLTRTETGSAGGSTYWQTSGGTQLQVPHRDLWMRAEGTAARNVDLPTQNFVPRESLSLGLNGQLTRQMSVALNVNLDRSPLPSATGGPWMTRSTLRVSRNLPTGSVYMANNAAVVASANGRGTGTVGGAVFADWNANGRPDPGENWLEGIPLRLGQGHSNTARDGQFAFVNVPVGLQTIGLDTGALPIDFDPPAVTQIQIELSRGDTKRVAFGLIPLGSIHGRVTRDANGNGKSDPNEDAIDGAVVILDGGARSEQSRKGSFRFDAVRSGDHLVKLLIESLPEGAVITGDAEVAAPLGRGHLFTDVAFLVSIEKRPEIRKVFPPRSGGGTASAAAGAASRAARTAAARPAAVAAAPQAAGRALSMPTPKTSAAERGFAIQIAALNDPVRARELVRDLNGSGLAAYVLEPTAADPDAPFRVRVGPYDTASSAQTAVAALEKIRREKLWVIRITNH